MKYIFLSLVLLCGCVPHRGKVTNKEIYQSNQVSATITVNGEPTIIRYDNYLSYHITITSGRGYLRRFIVDENNFNNIQLGDEVYIP